MLLALETANEGCSVSLYDGQQIVAHRQDERAREQTRLILPMIDAVLKQENIHWQSVQAIAFSRGPGSFSGVRINAAVTQGLAWAHDLPVIPVSTLQALAQATYRLKGCQQVSAVIDARMQEVYSATYCVDENFLMQPVQDEQLIGYEQFQSAVFNHRTVLAGNGVHLVSGVNQIDPETQCYADIMPSSMDIAILGWAMLQQGKAVTAEHALPVYLRDNAWKKLADQKR